MMPLEIELVTTEKCNLSCAYCYMNNNSRAFNIEILKQYGFKNFFGENRITIKELAICKTK